MKLKSVLLGVLGFVTFFVLLVLVFLAAFYVPFFWLKVGGFVLLVVAGLIRFVFKSVYVKIGDFVEKSHELYYFVKGIGIGFLFFIVVFFGAMVYAVLMAGS